MVDQRKANRDWTVAEADGSIPTWERIGIAVLMDIRDELQRLNALLRCDHFLQMPKTLRDIRRNTAKPRTRKGSTKRVKKS